MNETLIVPDGTTTITSATIPAERIAAAETVMIPESVVEIVHGVLFNCLSLKKIRLPFRFKGRIGSLLHGFSGVAEVEYYLGDWQETCWILDVRGDDETCAQRLAALNHEEQLRVLRSSPNFLSPEGLRSFLEENMTDEEVRELQEHWLRLARQYRTLEEGSSSRESVRTGVSPARRSQDVRNWDRLNDETRAEILESIERDSSWMSGTDWAGQNLYGTERWQEWWRGENRFTGLLQVHPEYARYCDWTKLTGADWYSLLTRESPFIEKCAQNAATCDWSDLRGFGWQFLIKLCPQLAEYCDWWKLTGEDWSLLLRDAPQWVDRCDLSVLEKSDWRRLLLSQPKFADRCDWSMMTEDDCLNLMRGQPQLVAFCAWSRVSIKHWISLLRDRPQLAEELDWSQLNGQDWCAVLCRLPQYADRCDWSKLTDKDRSKLLRKQPQLSVYGSGAARQ